MVGAIFSEGRRDRATVMAQWCPHHGRVSRKKGHTQGKTVQSIQERRSGWATSGDSAQTQPRNTDLELGSRTRWVLGREI